MSWTIETYKKRSGTSDHGKEFEYLMCAFYTLKLIDCNEVSDFEMYTNHASCGDFDDVALRVKFIDGSVKLFLLQLKHSENKKNLYLRELEAPKGDFSLFKYQQCHQNINLDEFKKKCEENKFDVRFILFTNKHAAFEDDDKLTLQTEEWQIKESTNDLYQNFLNTSEDENCIFTIKSCQANSCTERENFLKNFFIYTDQKNHQSIKKILGELLNKLLSCNFDKEKFILFFRKWWEGKFVLTKADVIMKLSEVVFSPWIKTLSDQKYDNRSKLLKEAIMTFDITVVGDVGGDIVETIWDQPNCDEKSVAMVTQKFGLADGYVDKLTTEKIFWYMDEAPFVIKLTESNKEQIHSAILLLEHHGIKKKLVLKFKCKEINLPHGWKVLQNLFGLKKEKEELFHRITKEFQISLQGNDTISLGNLIGADEENAKFLDMDLLFSILSVENNDYCVEKNKEDLPQEYLPRMVSTTFLDIKYLLQQSFVDENILIINCNNKFNLIDDIICQRNIKTVRISKYLKSEDGIVIISETNENALELFQKITVNANKNVHLVKIISDKCSMLIASSGNRGKLRHFNLVVSPKIKEENIHDVFNGSVNFICDEPGMGKSTTMKYLNNKAPSDSWAIFIELKKYNSFFKRNFKTEEILSKLLFMERGSILSNIKEILLRRKKIIFLFDGLDEMEHSCIDKVIDFIKEISSKGLRVWISAREILQMKVETQLKIFPIKIIELSKTEQEEYIKVRLKDNYKNEEIKEIVEKISQSVNISNNNKILGIPLQLYIITQILIDNGPFYSKIDEEMFVLTNLYRKFFEGNIKHVLKKKGLVDEDLADEISTSELSKYAIPALKVCLTEEDYERLNLSSSEISKNDEVLDSIRKKGDYYGIIKQIGTDGKAMYGHQTYAEYFACLFLSKNFDKAQNIKYQLFNTNYANLKLLLDLELASESPLHISIIYRNTELMTENLNQNFHIIKDKGNRSPLHLICSYAMKYENIQKRGNVYFISDEILTLQKENSFLQEIIIKLAKLCSPMEKDEFFKWNAIEYASISHCLFPIEAIMENLTCPKEILNTIFSTFDEGTLLYYATRLGYCKLLNTVIANNRFIVIEKKYGSQSTSNRSILNVALAEYKNIEITKMLLTCGISSTEIRDTAGRNAFHYAAMHENYDALKLLIEQGVDLNCVSYFGTVLHEACEKGNYKLINFLMNHNINLDMKDRDGKTALYYAAHKGNVDIVKLLIQKGADPNCITDDGRTILHGAATRGNCELIDYLLAQKIDPNLKNAHGRTALYYAAHNGNNDVVKLLIQKGADINSISNDGKHLLHEVAMLGNCDMIEYLLEYNVDLNVKNIRGETALFYAVKCKNKDVIKLLIDKGADINIVTNQGKSLVDFARLVDDQEVLHILLTYQNKKQ